MLISAVQSSESLICVSFFFLRFFPHIGHYRVRSRALYAIQEPVLVPRGFQRDTPSGRLDCSSACVQLRSSGRYGQSLPTKSKPPHQYQPHRALLRMRGMHSTERWLKMPLLHYRASPGILTLDTLAGQADVLGIYTRLRSTPHPAQSSLATEKPASLRVLTTALIQWLPEELPPSPWGPGGQGQQHAELRSREPLRPSGQR